MPESLIVPNGALPDIRPSDEKKKDYIADEVASVAAVVTFKNPKITKLTGTVYDQWYTSSCVLHGFYTQLEYEGIVPAKGMSQLRAYRKRVNYPQPGTGGVDGYMKIKAGQNYNADAPVTTGMAEMTANAMPYVEGLKLISDFDFLQYLDSAGNLKLNGVVPDVAAGKAVSIFIYADENEWAQEYVTIKNPTLTPDKAYVRHCVCIVPKGDFTENGRQWLAIHDSAKFGGRHLRYIRDDFFFKRCYFAAKVVKTGDFPPLPPIPQKPTIAVKLGERGEAVRVLQAYLAERKFLEAQYITGLYGQLTSKAVLWWQLYHHEKFNSSIPELLTLKGENFGPQSLKVVQQVS